MFQHIITIPIRSALLFFIAALVLMVKLSLFVSYYSSVVVCSRVVSFWQRMTWASCSTRWWFARNRFTLGLLFL